MFAIPPICTARINSHVCSLRLLLRSIRQIYPIVLAFDFFDDFLHLLLLPVPLVFAHLGLFLEQFLVGLAVAAAQAVPEGRELSVTANRKLAVWRQKPLKEKLTCS